MRKRYAIEYEIKPRTERLFWAYFEGTKQQAEASAKGLMYSMRYEQGLKKARTFLDNKPLQLRKQDIESYGDI